VDQVKTIGVVGGVASGKSLVSQQLAKLGAGVLDADRAGHDVLTDDPEVRAALVNRWGPTILTADGHVARRAVAIHVFADTPAAIENRKFLEDLLHPRIRALLDDQRRQFLDEGRPAVVLDAPLLLEARWGPMCDVILFVDTPLSARLAHAKTRGWSEAEFNRREASQWPVEKKRLAANAVLSNSGSVDELRAAVARTWKELVVGD
jgi:dephospho-CoA kinase